MRFLLLAVVLALVAFVFVRLEAIKSSPFGETLQPSKQSQDQASSQLGSDTNSYPPILRPRLGRSRAAGSVTSPQKPASDKIPNELILRFDSNAELRAFLARAPSKEIK